MIAFINRGRMTRWVFAVMRLIPLSLVSRIMRAFSIPLRIRIIRPSLEYIGVAPRYSSSFVCVEVLEVVESHVTGNFLLRGRMLFNAGVVGESCMVGV